MAITALTAEAERSLQTAKDNIEKAKADVKFIEGYMYALTQINPAIEQIGKQKKEDADKQS